MVGDFPSAFIAKAMPEIIPPPPNGTTNTSTSGYCAAISNPITPLPIITSSSATGWIKNPSTPADLFIIIFHQSENETDVTLAPRFMRESTFDFDAVSGTNT